FLAKFKVDLTEITSYSIQSDVEARIKNPHSPESSKEHEEGSKVRARPRTTHRGTVIPLLSSRSVV
ncbi:MAG: hypothetical protein QXL28_05210, partial [Desulfurococcaceae archaeon]